MYNLNIGANAFSQEGWMNLDKPSRRYRKEQGKIDIPHDLLSGNPISIDDGTLSAAYTSHTIEHVTDEAVKRLFGEVYRTLKDDGTFRVTCPDVGKCYSAYMSGDAEYIGNWLANKGKRERFKTQHGLGEQFVFIFASYLSTFNGQRGVRHYSEREITEIFKTKGKEEALTFFTDECQRTAIHLQEETPGNHVSWWDFDKIKNLMESVGFKDVKQKEFNESDYEVFQNFDELNKDNVTQRPYTVFVEARK